MGKRFKSYCLILVSMIMLTALVIPHHHHGERVCLKYDQEMSSPHTEDCSDNLQGSAHDDFCKISCVTHIILNKVECNQDIHPDYSFFAIVYDALSSMALADDGQASAKQEIFYLERLYPQCLVAECGLRAPPSQYILL